MRGAEPSGNAAILWFGWRKMRWKIPKESLRIRIALCAPGVYYREMPTEKKSPARKPNSALMKPVQPDEALAKIVGSKPLPRGEMTKKLWDYIKKNKLQDEKKKTLINADDALKVVFGGKKQVTMFEMTKHVSGHVKARRPQIRFQDIGRGLIQRSDHARCMGAPMSLHNVPAAPIGVLAKTLRLGLDSPRRFTVSRSARRDLCSLPRRALSVCSGRGRGLE